MNNYEIHLDKLDPDNFDIILNELENLAKQATEAPWRADTDRDPINQWVIRVGNESRGFFAKGLLPHDAKYVAGMDPRVALVLCAIAREWNQTKRMAPLSKQSRLDTVD